KCQNRWPPVGCLVVARARAPSAEPQDRRWIRQQACQYRFAARERGRAAGRPGEAQRGARQESGNLVRGGGGACRSAGRARCRGPWPKRARPALRQYPAAVFLFAARSWHRTRRKGGPGAGGESATIPEIRLKLEGGAADMIR